MNMGIDRLYKISVSLRTFSRGDREQKLLFNLNEGIDSSLLILKHRLKANSSRPEIQVVKELNDIPPIKCFAGQINQVLMNLLANAIDALDEASLAHSFEYWQQNPNIITIQAEQLTELSAITLYIQDNGVGMDAKVQQKAFEHLFTTKAVGKGTGLGLAIAHQIIVDNHNGRISFESTQGKGTRFAITLPIDNADIPL